jgi:hypothetical protein
MFDPVSMGLMLFSTGVKTVGGILGAQSNAKSQIRGLAAQSRAALNSAAFEAEDTIDDAFYSAGRSTKSAAYMGERAARAYGDAQDRAARNAELTLQTTAIEENRLLDQGEEVFASQAVFYGGGGIDMSEGAPVLMAARAAEQLDMDATIIRASGWARAAEFSGEARRFAIAADDAVTEAGLTIDDAQEGARRTGAKALRTLGFRQQDALTSFATGGRAAAAQASNATAAALLGGAADIAGGIGRLRVPGARS